MESFRGCTTKNMSQLPNENKVLDQKCHLLLNESEVRFVGVINKMGQQIAGGFKKTIMPLLDKNDQKVSLEHALEIVLTKDLDGSLGSIDNIITHRKKVTMITIPMRNFSILISAKRDSNAEKIIEKASKLFQAD